MKRPSEIGRAADFYCNAVHLLRAGKGIESAIDEHAHGELVDGRRFDWRGGSNFHACEAASCRGPGESCRSFQEVSTFEIVHDALPDAHRASMRGSATCRAKRNG